MTGKHLAPDTAREISDLKRRVSDLERMLDRVRRTASLDVAITYDTPYAALRASSSLLVATDELTVLPLTTGRVNDHTGHIRVDDSEDRGWFVYTTPGFYEIGATVRFFEEDAQGSRTLAIQPTYTDAPATPIVVLTVGRSPSWTTVLSGSRIVYIDEYTFLRWRVAVSHDAGADVPVSCEAFWTRYVTNGAPPTQVGSA